MATNVPASLLEVTSCNTCAVLKHNHLSYCNEKNKVLSLCNKKTETLTLIAVFIFPLFINIPVSNINKFMKLQAKE